MSAFSLRFALCWRAGTFAGRRAFILEEVPDKTPSRSPAKRVRSVGGRAQIKPICFRQTRPETKRLRRRSSEGDVRKETRGAGDIRSWASLTRKATRNEPAVTVTSSFVCHKSTSSCSLLPAFPANRGRKTFTRRAKRLETP